MHTPLKSQQAAHGFTLAELLIALTILAEIATFTIPKILTAQTNSQNNAIAKESMSIISGAFQLYQLKNTVSASTKSSDLMQYINYVAVDTASTIDNTPGYGTQSCTSMICLKLHNGGMLSIHNNETFTGTEANNGVWFSIDPDGAVSNVKAATFFLMYNGRITTSGLCNSVGVISSEGTYGCSAANDPSWLSF